MDGLQGKPHLEMDDDWGYPYDSGNLHRSTIHIHEPGKVIGLLFATWAENNLGAPACSKPVPNNDPLMSRLPVAQSTALHCRLPVPELGKKSCTFLLVPGLVNIQKNDGKSPSLMGKSTINGSCSIAMLVYKRVMGEHNGMFTIYQLLQEFPYHGSSLLHCCNPPKKDEDNLSFVRHV